MSKLFAKALTPLLLCSALATACAQKAQVATEPTVKDLPPEATLLSAEESKELKAEQAVEKNEKMIKRMLADDSAYYGKAVSLTTPLETSTYFNYRYRSKKDSYYSFKVGEYSEYFHVYGPKEKFREVFEAILEDENTLFNIEVTTSKKNGDNAIWTLLKAEKAE